MLNHKDTKEHEERKLASSASFAVQFLISAHLCKSVVELTSSGQICGEEIQEPPWHSRYYNGCVFQLRKYQPADFEPLLEIDQTCFTTGIAYSEAELLYFLSMPLAIVLVGARGAHIEGFIIANHHRSRRSSRAVGKIITIDVAPAAQHSGLGSLLISGAEAELQQAGCTYVSLEVAVDNEPALKFYKKHAYTVLKVLPRYYLDSMDGLLMGKKL